MSMDSCLLLRGKKAKSMMLAVSFKPEVLDMNFCCVFNMMSETFWSWLVCSYFVRMFRALKPLQFSVHNVQHSCPVQHWNRCPSWKGGAGDGLQVKNKIWQLGNVEVSASSGLDPKPADVSKLYISLRRIQLLENATEPITLLGGGQGCGEKAGCGFFDKSKSRCF